MARQMTKSLNFSKKTIITVGACAVATVVGVFALVSTVRNSSESANDTLSFLTAKAEAKAAEKAQAEADAKAETDAQKAEWDNRYDELTTAVNDLKSEVEGVSDTITTTVQASTDVNGDGVVDENDTVVVTETTDGTAGTDVGTNTSEDAYSVYQIQNGDTLSKISGEPGVSVDAIAHDNEIENVNLIYKDSALQIRNN